MDKVPDIPDKYKDARTSVPENIFVDGGLRHIFFHEDGRLQLTDHEDGLIVTIEPTPSPVQSFDTNGPPET